MSDFFPLYRPCGMETDGKDGNYELPLPRGARLTEVLGQGGLRKVEVEGVTLGLLGATTHHDDEAGVPGRESFGASEPGLLRLAAILLGLLLGAARASR